MMTHDSINTIDEQCNDILKVKNIISNYLDNPTNNTKIQEVMNITDVDNPLFIFSHYLKITAETLDMLLIMKQTKKLNLN